MCPPRVRRSTATDMAAEEEIRARLEASAPLTAAGVLIFAGRAPQDQPPPFVIWQRVSGFSTHVLDGRTDIKAGRFQVDVYAGSYADARRLAQHAADAIELSNNAHLHAELGSEIDLYDDDPPAMWRRSMDFMTKERIV